jgi:hypothetical protein
MAIDPSVRERVSLAGLVHSARAARRRGDLGANIALIPAYNEEDQIEAAIRSLQEQESPPDLIIVCADNRTDRTAPRAEAAGAHVFETIQNVHRKAGALNQALDILLPELHDEDAAEAFAVFNASRPVVLASSCWSGVSPRLFSF